MGTRSFWKTTPEHLARLIRSALRAELPRSNARALAHAMEGEDGAGTALAQLERLVRSKSPLTRRLEALEG